MLLDFTVNTINCDLNIGVILEIYSLHDNYGLLTSLANLFLQFSHVWMDSDKPPVILSIVSVEGRGLAVLVAHFELKLRLLEC